MRFELKNSNAKHNSLLPLTIDRLMPTKIDFHSGKNPTFNTPLSDYAISLSARLKEPVIRCNVLGK